MEKVFLNSVDECSQSPCMWVAVRLVRDRFKICFSFMTVLADNLFRWCCWSNKKPFAKWFGPNRLLFHPNGERVQVCVCARACVGVVTITDYVIFISNSIIRHTHMHTSHRSFSDCSQHGEKFDWKLSLFSNVCVSSEKKQAQFGIRQNGNCIRFGKTKRIRVILMRATAKRRLCHGIYTLRRVDNRANQKISAQQWANKFR